MPGFLRGYIVKFVVDQPRVWRVQGLGDCSGHKWGPGLHDCEVVPAWGHFVPSEFQTLASGSAEHQITTYSRRTRGRRPKTFQVLLEEPLKDLIDKAIAHLVAWENEAAEIEKQLQSRIALAAISAVGLAEAEMAGLEAAARQWEPEWCSALVTPNKVPSAGGGLSRRR